MRCQASALKCACHKTESHEDDLHECNPAVCTGAWRGDPRSLDFQVVRFPFQPWLSVEERQAIWESTPLPNKPMIDLATGEIILSTDPVIQARRGGIWYGRPNTAGSLG